jgi:hypothetical protein
LKLVEDAVCRDRTVTHGNPEDNFATIAALWRGYLTGRFGVDLALQPTDVAWMSLLIKVARAASNPAHADHYVDAAGYATCGYGLLAPPGVDSGGARCMGSVAPRTDGAFPLLRNAKGQDVRVESVVDGSPWLSDELTAPLTRSVHLDFDYAVVYEDRRWTVYHDRRDGTLLTVEKPLVDHVG